MSEEWTDTILGKVANLRRGYDLPKRLREDGPYPVVSSSGLTGTHNDYKVDPPGVVTGRYGTLGRVYFVEAPMWPLNTTLYVDDFKGNVPRYVAYLLESLKLDELVASAAVPGINRNHIHPLAVRVPSVATQLRIASALGSLDKLIENNRQRINILAQMARLSYEEWFVHHRFPGHKTSEMVDDESGGLPQGWSRVNLFDLAEVAFGYPFNSEGFGDMGPVRVVRIRDLPKNASYTFTDENPGQRYKIEDGDTLIGMDGHFHMCRWADGAAYLNQRVARIRSNGTLNQFHLHLALEYPIQQLNRSITGTTVAHLGKRHLEEILIAVPTTSVRAAASAMFEPLFQLERNLRKQNHALTVTRNLLLPRIVLGEVDVPHFDSELEAVGV